MESKAPHEVSLGDSWLAACFLSWSSEAFQKEKLRSIHGLLLRVADDDSDKEAVESARPSKGREEEANHVLFLRCTPRSCTNI